MVKVIVPATPSVAEVITTERCLSTSVRRSAPEGRGGHHAGGVFVEERRGEPPAEGGGRDIRADAVIPPLEPRDLAGLRLVDPVVDRALLADELLHRALVLDALVLVPAALR